MLLTENSSIFAMCKIIIKSRRVCRQVSGVLNILGFQRQYLRYPTRIAVPLLCASCVLSFLLWRLGFCKVYLDLLQSLLWVCGSGSIFLKAMAGSDNILLCLICALCRELVWVCVTVDCMWRGPNVSACCRLCRPIFCEACGRRCCLFL